VTVAKYDVEPVPVLLSTCNCPGREWEWKVVHHLSMVSFVLLN